VYVGYPAAAGEPPRQLRGYAKVFLNPGESRQVSVSLSPQAFAYWDVTRNAWTIPGGTYQVFVGGSSRSLPLQSSLGVAKKLLGP
jgi:beta-glucosidase